VDAAWLSEVTGIQFAVKEDAGAVAIRQGGVA
jgi:hypothetical protein